MSPACRSARGLGSIQKPRSGVVSRRDELAICYDYRGCRDFDPFQTSTRTMTQASIWPPTPRSGGSAAATCESFLDGVSQRSAPRANERGRVQAPLVRRERQAGRSRRKGRVR